LKTELNYNISENANLIAGGSYTFHAVEPIRMYIQGAELYSKKDCASEAAIFAQLNLNFANSDVLSLGLRQNIYLHDSASYFPFEPRLSYIKEFKKFGILKSSISRNIQFIHRVEDFSTGLPTELWYVSNKKMKYEEGYQLSVELSRRIKHWYMDVGAALYYKWMNSLVEYGSYYADLPLPNIFENLIVEVNGKGHAYGLEIFCSKQQGNFNYTISYLLSKSIRKFNTLNNGNWYPSYTDRLHNLNTTFSYKLNEKVLFSLAWIYSTGKPITVPEGRFFFDNKDTTPLYFIGNRNNFRLADYHRLDASVQFKKVKRKGTSTFEFGIYNAYNRRNPFSIDFEDEVVYENGVFKNTGRVKIKQYSLFPLIPSVSYIRNF
jgi:hypothetical protein